jgi:hypothetical protein
MNPDSPDRAAFGASAVLALMQEAPGADNLSQLQPRAIVNAVNPAEVLAKLVNRGMPAEEAQPAYDALHLETTRPVLLGGGQTVRVRMGLRSEPRSAVWALNFFR